MELRHLRYFTAIAEEGNLTRAAERLGIQQPPLSQQLQALERELGLQLFERRPRGMQLTDAGVAFLEDVRAALSGLEAGTDRARRVATGMHGSLTLGVASSASTHHIVPETIAAFRERYPDVHMSFVEGNAAVLTEAVLARKVHAALVRAPVDRPADIRFDRLFTEPMLAAVPVTHALAAKGAKRSPGYITLKELAAEPLVLVRLPGAPGMYADLLAACDAAGLKPRIAAEVRTMLTNMLLVAAGVGLSVVPASMRGIHPERVRYFQLRGARGLAAPLTLLTHRNETNPVVARFAAVVREFERAGA